MRDFISEIIEIRDRQGRSLTLEIIQELGQLNEAWQEKTLHRDILRTYIPIRIATIIEVFSRNWISMIIDHGDPFLTRGLSLSKNISIKFDLPLVSAIQGNKITIGELISHNLPYNNMAQIDSNLTHILDQKLKPLLSDAKVRLLDEEFNAHFDDIVTDVDNDYKVMEKLFKVRHVIVHEVPEVFPASDDE